ncbi:MAG: DUF502 domain-containing protein [Gammaproteobacteria bacterium]
MKKNRIKNYLIAGCLVLAPLWVTVSLISYLIEKFDNIMALVPAAYRPETFIGFRIPGLGLLVVLIIVFFTGMLVTNFIGKYLVGLGEALLAKIPLVRSIYASVQQILSTMFKPSGQSFRKVVMIEYPRKGAWTMAFQTGSGMPEINENTGEEMLTVFVPTTPNPTGGYLLFVPKKDVKELSISVDAALKFIISLGVILPKKSVKIERK